MKVLAFDLDGTLISAESKQVGLLKAVCARFGVKLPWREVWALKRDGLSNLNLLLKFGVERDLALGMARAWQRDIESPYWLMLDVLHLDAVRILLAARGAGYRSVIVTARSNQALLRQQLHRLALLKYVDQVFCVPPTDATRAKCEILASVRPLAFFGDTEVDYAASQLAGLPFYGVSTGLRSAEFLYSRGASAVSSSLETAVQLFMAGGASPASSSADCGVF